MTGAREAVLGRVRNALADVAGRPDGPLGRDYRRALDEERETTVERFAERAAEYRATVRRAAAGDLPDVLGALCREAGARRLGIAAGLPAEWRPADVELVPDTGLAATDLDALDGALTGCALAIAETGTIVLDGGPGQGRRALTLVPDYHLCVVPADAIVGLVPEDKRAEAERAHAVHQRACPVARSIGGSIEIETKLELV